MPFAIISSKRAAKRRDVDWRRAEGIRWSSPFARHLDAVLVPDVNRWNNLVKPEYPALPGTEGGTFVSDSVGSYDHGASRGVAPANHMRDRSNNPIYTVRGATADDSCFEYSSWPTRGFTALTTVSRVRPSTSHSAGYLFLWGSNSPRRHGLGMDGAGYVFPYYNDADRGTLTGGFPASVGASHFVGMTVDPNAVSGGSARWMFSNRPWEGVSVDLTGNATGAILKPSDGFTFFSLMARHGGSSTGMGWNWDSTSLGLGPVFVWSRSAINSSDSDGSITDRTEWDTLLRGEFADLIAFSRARVIFLPAAGGGGGATLDVEALVHSHTLGSAALTAQSPLVVEALSHAQTLVASALVAQHPLSLADLVHDQELTKAVLTPDSALAVESLAHELLLTASALQGASPLVLGSLIHAHQLVAAALSAASPLALESLSHGHTLVAADLVVAGTVGPESLQHVQTLQSATLQGHSLLAVGNLEHTSKITAAALLATTPLAVEDLSHDHTLTQADLQGIPVLTPEALQHVMILSPAGFTTDVSLTVEELVHAHTLGSVVIFSTDTFFVPTQGRIVRVAAERRVVVVKP